METRSFRFLLRSADKELYFRENSWNPRFGKYLEGMRLRSTRSSCTIVVTLTSQYRVGYVRAWACHTCQYVHTSYIFSEFQKIFHQVHWEVADCIWSVVQCRHGHNPCIKLTTCIKVVWIDMVDYGPYWIGCVFLVSVKSLVAEAWICSNHVPNSILQVQGGNTTKVQMFTNIIQSFQFSIVFFSPSVVFT